VNPVRVNDYLWNTSKFPVPPVCVVYGDDAFLRSSAVRHIRDQVLAAEDAEFALSRFDGENTKLEFKDVHRELRTTAMFGGSKRVVRVDEADSFVSKYRAELEKYVAAPSDQAVLILQLKSFLSTTNLFKKLVTSGLLIEAKTPTEKEMPGWVAQWSKLHYKTPCDKVAAEMIVERMGVEHGSGLLDQELAKLSLMVTDPKKGITPELVEQTVGSWRSRTVFEMLDLALAGKTAAAVRQLNALILAGEDAGNILRPIAPTLRKLAMATELILETERQNRKLSVRAALEKAGVGDKATNIRWKNQIIEKTEKQLIHLGRQRGTKLSNWLLQLDLDLKGDSKSGQSNPRLLLEMFIVKLSTTK